MGKGSDVQYRQSVEYFVFFFHVVYGNCVTFVWNKKIGSLCAKPGVTKRKKNKLHLVFGGLCESNNYNSFPFLFSKRCLQSF